MMAICERSILIHQMPKLEFGDELGQVPSEYDLKRGRKFTIQPSLTPQEIPDWCAEVDSFQNLVQKGVIKVVNFVKEKAQ